jgi:hypothetical protein
MNRRNFIKGSLRFAAAGGLIGLSGFLLMREHPQGSQACDFDFICQNCKKKKRCDLPEAKEFRNSAQSI